MTNDVHAADGHSRDVSTSTQKNSADDLISSQSSPNSKTQHTLLSKAKARALKWIDYDAQVVEAASVTDELKQAMGGNLSRGLQAYGTRLFPFFGWIWAYNLRWGLSDLVAGITVCLVLVPQSMSYAKVATLDPEYGLYSSFVGVMIYALFATSKEVTIGPVAVMSLEIARVIAKVQDKTGDLYSAPMIATCVAFLCGIIVLGIGLLRLGWIIQFIPAPAIAGFMTGSALNIAAGQVPSLLGYSSKLNTRAATYKVIINTLRLLPSTKLDAAFGLTGLFFLYFVRWTLARVERKSKNPVVKRIAFFATTLRTAFVIIILTIASWLTVRHQAKPSISILGTVPSGFKHMGRPSLPTGLMSAIAPELPVSTIILLLEHIAIATSFGRVNNYKIDPNQELIAIGVSNLVGTLFNAYPATGSFSRSAIKAKAGVRTPLAGWVTGAGVVIALYALTDAFYWIPNAALSAVIIHAVLDLIASPAQSYGFWKASPLEAIIFAAAVIVSIFATIEAGIYTSVAASLALLLIRIARPRGAFLGRVRLRPDLAPPSADGAADPKTAYDLPTRDVYLPLLPSGVTNPLVQVEPPPPGVIVFRFEESFLYPNASFYADIVLEYAKKTTRSGQNFEFSSRGDRPWNDPGVPPWKRNKRKGGVDTPDSAATAEQEKPLLRAVVFDMSSSSHIDTTSVQNLVDLKRSLERYAAQQVQFHFATILSPFIKRALLAGGFGTGVGWSGDERPLEIAPVVQAGLEPILTEHARRQQQKHFQRRFPLTPAPSTPQNGLKMRPLEERKEGEAEGQQRSEHEIRSEDLEAALGQAAAQGEHVQGNVWESNVPGFSGVEHVAPVVSSTFPRFHLDLTSAVAAAVGKDDW